ncbi:hypothetical protein K502DRAFT_367546 [Neoconidiobolus thromboides FSU 785]|nr:hypothetical protein K502DRAFT_367546 [Neoconidiobolus thromboides FSU 785]
MTQKEGSKSNETTLTKQQENKSNSLLIINMLILFSSITIYFLLNFVQSSTGQDNPESELPVPNKGFEYVTFGSLIKLTHSDTGYKLHSLNAQYGSGSGQQIVTGLNKQDDHDSFWTVRTEVGKKGVENGTPVKCGSIINLSHLNTGSYLHSHIHESPLSSNQEVSCFAGNDQGDNWQLICQETYWTRENKIQFLHVDTKKYLASDKKHVFPHPIQGQLEIFGKKKADESTYWRAQEGVYFASNVE